jgi:phospholipid/cholesterol/gamma-HCH transport system substrate-binding protein
MSLEAKVGSFVLAGFLLLGWAIFLLGDVSIERRYPIYVEFTDVAGLPDKAAVKLNGVEVGKVKEIRLRDGGVEVEVRVKHGTTIYRDSKFKVASTSVIGSKYLEITQGRASSGIIREGDSVKGVDQEDMVAALTSTLDKVQLTLDQLSENGRLGKNINAAVDNLRQTSLTMNELLAETKPALSASMKRMDDITQKLDDVLAKVDEVMAKVNSSSGPVGALLSDREMKEDIKSTVKDLKESAGTAKQVLGRITSFHTFWHYENRYEPNLEASRTDAGVRIYPRPGRYYYFGLSNIRDQNDPTPRTDFYGRNNLDAQLGWDWRDFNVHTGIIRGYGGAGIEVRPVHDVSFLDTVWLFADAYDFGRNRTTFGRHFKGSQVDVGIRSQVHRLVSLGARVQDVGVYPNFETDARITFEDKDVAYLLGLVTFGASTASGRSQ